MNMNARKWTIVLGVAMVVGSTPVVPKIGFAENPKRDIDAKQVQSNSYDDIGAYGPIGFFTHSIEFEFGQSEITVAALDDIKSLVDNANLSGQIDTVYIAVWSDKEFSLEREGALTAEDSNLASSRIQSIRKIFKENYPRIPLLTFNMAVRSDFWSKFFGTKEGELKGMMMEGSEESGESELSEIVERGEPSMAVLLVKMGRRDNRLSKKKSDSMKRDFH